MNAGRAYLETYGCALNQADSQIIKELLKKEGVRLVQEPGEADWVFLNTCAVKLSTENRMFSRIKRLKELPGQLVVCGCLPRINRKAVRETCPDCLMMDTNSLDKIPRLLKGEHKHFFSSSHVNKLRMPACREGLIVTVPIAEGCRGHCSFCCTRHARGRLTSYPVPDIRRAVEKAVQQGAREIRLTAEDTGIYGWDRSADRGTGRSADWSTGWGADRGADLPSLLEELVQVGGDFKMRVGMMNPSAAKKELPSLLRAFNSPKVYKFVHLPVQSGSDEILEKMNREYTVEDFEEVVRGFRDEFSLVSLATDVIVGFPGETEQDFHRTLDLMKRARPDIINVSMFYPRPRTPAKKMKKHPTQVVKKRSRLASQLASRISQERNRELIGKEFEVTFLEKGKKGGFVARLPNYKQLILDEAELGEEIRIRIVEAHPTYLKGRRA